jgi:hypothetical protein
MFYGGVQLRNPQNSMGREGLKLTGVERQFFQKKLKEQKNILWAPFEFFSQVRKF